MHPGGEIFLFSRKAPDPEKRSRKPAGPPFNGRPSSNGQIMGSILFIRGGAVGDLILTLPAVALVREQLPQARVELLGYPPTNRLALAAGLVDAARSMEYGPLASFFVPGGALPGELADYFAGFSVVVSYLYDPDGYFAENLRRAGVGTLIQGPPRVAESPGQAPAAAQLAEPLGALALFLEQPWVSLDFHPSIEAEADLIRSREQGETARWIALHPGSGSPRKNWSFEAWVEVAASLAAGCPGFRLLVTHGEAEDPVIADFFELLRRRGLPFASAGHLDLPTLGAVLKRCDGYLGHDSGISHLAAACGVPSVLLFGKTDPSIWAPRNPGVSTIRGPAGDLSRIRPGEVVALAEKRWGWRT